MAARSRGIGTNYDWLRKSCDISTCDLSPMEIRKGQKAYEISYRAIFHAFYRFFFILDVYDSVYMY